MKRPLVLVALVGLAVSLAWAFAVTDVAADQPQRNFVAHCTGDQEVPPRDTRAQGQAIFQLNTAETELHFRLIVANIENVFAAHIHTGAVGVNGPIVVFLYPGPAISGRTDGVLAEGTIADPSADLIAAMRAGNTYVNVHTNDGVAPPNTGPGDFPGGEIRGQIH
jgi:hypothetical protein